MKIETIYKSYIETKTISLSPKTVGSYISAYNIHIESIFGHRDIDTLNYIDYQNFANSLLEKGKKPKTVLNILRILSGIYQFAIKCSWYAGEIYPNLVELPKFDNKFYVTFSPELQKKYLMALKNADEPIFKDIFLFLLHGRRLGEVLNLEWEFLDLTQGIVYYPASHNKSKKHLSYELTSELIAVLKQYQAQAEEIQGTPFIKGYVFINPNTNKHYTDIRDAWLRMLSKSDLPFITRHNIRHVLGTYLVNEIGLSVEKVSYLLGHSDTRITQRYVSIKPQVAKNAIEALFEDFKTKEELYMDNLNNLHGMGEAIEKVLFSTNKLQGAE
ncbi:MAG: tyrosine-type recombinase/integrase [Sulfurovum sp.]|nr:tyrosine-type recombinase/integrase [Sulfurovum sp.]